MNQSRDYSYAQLERDWEEAEKIYHQGFTYMKEFEKYKEEMQDLENIYKEKIEEAKSDIDCCVPMFLKYMEEFLTSHKKLDEIREKLNDLQFKKQLEKEDIKDE